MRQEYEDYTENEEDDLIEYEEDYLGKEKVAIPDYDNCFEDEQKDDNWPDHLFEKR